MDTYFLSGGRQVTAEMMNSALAAGKRVGMHKPISTIEVVGDKFTLSSHSGSLLNGVFVVSQGEEFVSANYIPSTSNSYRGTLVYTVDSSLQFDACFNVVSGILMQQDTEDLVLGWVVKPANSALLTQHFYPAPASSETYWLDTLIELGEIPGLTRTVNGYVETYVNTSGDVVNYELIRHIAVAEQFVRSLRFNGSLNPNATLDCYCKSEQRDWSLVGSLAGPLENAKYRIPVFAFEQGNYEMTSVKFVFRVPNLASFSCGLIGVTNEVSYTQS